MPSPTLVARASNTVRNKNLLIVAMCLGFLVWFAYDGFVNWPRINDRGVTKLQKMMAQGELKAKDDAQLDQWKSALAAWPGWNKASQSDREEIYQIATEGMTIAGGVEGFKRPFDIELQLYIVYGLAAAFLISLWWLFHCQRRRCIADDDTVSPSPGIVILWEKITIVDNTRWKKSGIVEITYTDAAGKAQQAKFDDYELDREPLLSILDLLAEKAANAEFIPREEPAAVSPPPPAP